MHKEFVEKDKISLMKTEKRVLTLTVLKKIKTKPVSRKLPKTWKRGVFNGIYNKHLIGVKTQDIIFLMLIFMFNIGVLMNNVSVSYQSHRQVRSNHFLITISMVKKVP